MTTAAPLPCRGPCGGFGTVEVTIGHPNDPWASIRTEPCERCRGAGVESCEEPGCREAATHEFRERDQIYPLCAPHFALWCEDTEAAP